MAVFAPRVFEQCVYAARDQRGFFPATNGRVTPTSIAVNGRYHVAEFGPVERVGRLAGDAEPTGFPFEVFACERTPKIV